MAAHKPKVAKDVPASAPTGSEAKDNPVWSPPASRQQVFKDVCAKLTEFFDAGIIGVTWVENGETFRLNHELGNKFAVTGLVEQISMEHSDGLCQDLLDDDEDEDNEDWKKAPA